MNTQHEHAHASAGYYEWPGANFVVFPSGEKVYLKFGDRRRVASELKIGDVVERHLDSECSGAKRVGAIGLVLLAFVPNTFPRTSMPTRPPHPRATPAAPTRQRHCAVQPPALAAPDVYYGSPRGHHALAHTAVQ